MSSMGLMHWAVVASALLLFVPPVALILKKAGYSPLLVLLLLVPGMPLIGLWFLALARWPTLAKRERA